MPAHIADVVALADLDAEVPKDVVRRYDVEIEVRQRPVAEELVAGHLEGHFGARDGDDDRAILRTLERACPRSPQHFYGRLDARLEVGECGADVLGRRPLSPGEPRRGIGGVVTGELHLLTERVHIGSEPTLDEDG